MPNVTGLFYSMFRRGHSFFFSKVVKNVTFLLTFHFCSFLLTTKLFLCQNPFNSQEIGERVLGVMFRHVSIRIRQDGRVNPKKLSVLRFSYCARSYRNSTDFQHLFSRKAKFNRSWRASTHLLLFIYLLSSFYFSSSTFSLKTFRRETLFEVIRFKMRGCVEYE